MFGLMEVGLRIGFLLSFPLVLGFLRVIPTVFGLGVIGGILIVMTRGIGLLLPVVGTVLFQALCQTVQRAELWGVIPCLAGFLWCSPRC